jgi:hypothetical protein
VNAKLEEKMPRPEPRSARASLPLLSEHPVEAQVDSANDRRPVENMAPGANPRRKSPAKRIDSADTRARLRRSAEMR